jgi:PBP1b-binding outer membrane lipoprotein LpoB
MKKLICILASAALLGACEQKTEVAPAAPAEKKTETNTTVVNPPADKATERAREKIKTTTDTTNTITTAPAPVTSTETKTDTTTTTTASPNP